MRRVWLAAQVALAAAVVWFAGRRLVAGWSEVREAASGLTLDPVAIAAAAGVILATYALLISAWRAVLLGWGERLRYPAAARIWCLSNLARYVPGRVWQIAGMAAMAQRAGVSPWAAAGSAVIVQLLAIGTGAVVTGLFAVETGYPVVIAASGAVAVLAALALASPRATAVLSRTLTRLLGRELKLEPVGKGALAASAAVTALAWISYGVALYLLVQGLLGEPRLSIGAAVGAFTASYLLGLVAVFTPGGLGVREGVIFLLLERPLGPGAATLVTVGSRLLMTATEVVAGLLTLPLGSDGRR